jgi:high-affinity nickel-transport protein
MQIPIHSGEEFSLAMNTLTLVGLGLILGMRHATDPDHVVAVTAIAARHKRLVPAALIGALWGMGHTLTIFVVGTAIILFNLTVPPRVGLSLEFAVGLALTAVGLWNLSGRQGIMGAAAAEGRLPSSRAFGLGLVHGLAGSAAVALLVLATVHDPGPAVAYLLLFGAGTILGMMIITTAFALPAGMAARRFHSFAPRLRLATGVLSLAFGLYVMGQIGFVDGLFRSTPHWTPH